jgi:GH18 family chitinase
MAMKGREWYIEFHETLDDLNGLNIDWEHPEEEEAEEEDA